LRVLCASLKHNQKDHVSIDLSENFYDQMLEKLSCARFFMLLMAGVEPFSFKGPMAWSVIRSALALTLADANDR
tara:strand:+ start:260 stop:481 length:222 start_codon:yes stop_codon:yes gene_type:complete